MITEPGLEGYDRALIREVLTAWLDKEPVEQIMIILEEKMPREEAEYVMSRLPFLAAQKKESARQGMVFGLFVFLAGLGLKLVTPDYGYVSFPDILSWCCMIGGIAYLLDSWYRVRRYN
jgi:hypothetical protein